MGRTGPVLGTLWLTACPGTGLDDSGDEPYTCPANEDASAWIAEECCTGELTLTVGTGTDPFEEREEGSCHTMIHGPQGGWHMEVSARVCGTYDRVYLHYEIYDVETGIQISDNTYKVALQPETEGCCGVFDGMFGFLDMSDLSTEEARNPPELICLNELELRLEVWDLAGQVVQTDRRVIGAPHEDDLHLCDPGECLVESEEPDVQADSGEPSGLETQ